MAYIHENSVKARLVDEPWEYRYSSARDYMNNQKGLLDVDRTADAVDMKLRGFESFAGLVELQYAVFSEHYAQRWEIGFNSINSTVVNP